LEDCIRTVAELGVDGVEIVGNQSVRGYPWPTDETILSIRRMVDKYKLKLICLDGNADRGMRSDRLDLTEDEMYAYAADAIRVAQKFGTPVYKHQLNMTPPVMERVAPLAEKYKVITTIEMHQPMSPTDPESMEFTRIFERLKSPWIGWTPDFGAWAERANPLHVEALRKSVKSDIFDYVIKAGEQNLPIEKVVPELTKMGVNAEQIAMIRARYNFLICRPVDLEGLKGLIPYCKHFHGKFHYLNQDGSDAAIPSGKLLAVLRDSSYEGYVALEYEGHGMVSADAVPILKKHLAFCQKALAA
jgi:sugar phosphate isomerase/epimerase